MKKSLIALAVAGAFAAPAFAATENVDVYGKVHMSVSSFSDQDPVDSDLQISSNASRFGIKGAEDLGNGMSAIWQIESGVNLDEQNGTLANRNSFVGLKGGFGTVLLGNHDTPLKLVGRAVDLFGDTMADSRNIMGGSAEFPGLGMVTDTRADNVVAYITPDFSGFTAAIAYTTDPFSASTGQSYGDINDTSVISANATYNNGPLYVGFGYSTGDALDAALIDSEMRLAAGFTMGNFKVVAQYDVSDADVFGYSAWMLGGAFTMGNVVLKANYMAGEFDDCTGSDVCEPTQFTIGADYNLSKRSTVYALYSAQEGNFFMGGYGYGAGSSDKLYSVDPDGEISVLSVGVTHSF